MPESYKNLSVIFQKAHSQKDWFAELLQTRSMSEVSKICGCTERTIRDWKNEKYRMNLECLERLCKQYALPRPRVKTISRYAHAKEAGTKGAEVTLKKYGRVPINEKVRKKKWNEWWEREGKHTTRIVQPRLVVFPKKHTTELAEFVGIMMGDGGISKSQVSITLHRKDDLEYSKFVRKLCEKLFCLRPSVYIREKHNTLVIVISRVALVKFLTEKIGLVKGNKIDQQIAVPEWIMARRSYSISCLRGLVDTDGSVFTHTYKVKDKMYSYKKLSFTSASNPLRGDVKTILESLGMKPREAGHFDIRLDSKNDMEKYFRIVGSSNPKHLKRWLK